MNGSLGADIAGPSLTPPGVSLFHSADIGVELESKLISTTTTEGCASMERKLRSEDIISSNTGHRW